MVAVSIIVLTIAVLVLMSKVSRLEREVSGLKFKRKVGGRY